MSIQAFPGAYGWGAESVGGRGGYVYEVTNLNANGPGSLLKGCEVESGPRIIIPRVAGEIDLGDSAINIRNPYITIPLQAAPGSGITITNGTISIETHNVILQYLRGRGNGVSAWPGFIRFRASAGGVHDVIVDHCSGNWSTDDLVDGWHSEKYHPAIYNITIQNSIFAEPLANHPTNMLFGTKVSLRPSTDMNHISVLNNLFYGPSWRNPLFAGDHCQAINNVVYNYGYWICGWGRDGESDFINNYFKPGPFAGNGYVVRDYIVDDGIGKCYINGNILPGILDDPSDDNWVIVRDNDGNLLPPTDEATYRRLVPLAQSPNPLPIKTAADAFSALHVGANRRLEADGSWISNPDSLDVGYINDVLNGTGPSDYVASAGAIPVQVPGIPYPDSNGDGIPDGYSGTLEEFLNFTNGGGIMPVLDDLIAVEAALRQEVLDLTAQADAIAQAILDLQAVDDALDAAADVIVVD